MNWVDEIRQTYSRNSVDDLGKLVCELRGAKMSIRAQIEELKDRESELDIEIIRANQRINKMEGISYENAS